MPVEQLGRPRVVGVHGARPAPALQISRRARSRTSSLVVFSHFTSALMIPNSRSRSISAAASPSAARSAGPAAPAPALPPPAEPVLPADAAPPACFLTARRAARFFAGSDSSTSTNSLCRWQDSHARVLRLFGRQAIPMVWSFAEPNVFAGAFGDIATAVETVVTVLSALGRTNVPVRIGQADARQAPNFVAVRSTDPPYYDNIGYADLSDFFYVWLRRSLRPIYPDPSRPGRATCRSRGPRPHGSTPRASVGAAGPRASAPTIALRLMGGPRAMQVPMRTRATSRRGSGRTTSTSSRSTCGSGRGRRRCATAPGGGSIPRTTGSVCRPSRPGWSA